MNDRSSRRPPNVVVIMSDQHRFDVMGNAGHPVVRTPNMDRLAAEGVTFSRSYCQGPLCMPARASFLTERYVRDHLIFDNLHNIDPHDTPTFLHALGKAGYHTTCVGKMHFYRHDLGETGTSILGDSAANHADDLRALGFTEPLETVGKLACGSVDCEYTDYLDEIGLLDTYRDWIAVRRYSNQQVDGKTVEAKKLWETDPVPLPREAYMDAWHGRRAERWIDEYDGDDPFLCWVGFPGPHDPWDAPVEDLQQYRDLEIPLGNTTRPELPVDNEYRMYVDLWLNMFTDTKNLTNSRLRELRRAYYANVSVIDDGVGRILAALERRGMLDNTWVVYTADHGEMLGEKGFLTKMVFYEQSLRVPVLVRPPGGAEHPAAGRTVDTPIEHIDLPATVRELAGAPDVSGSDGRSLLGWFSADGMGVTRDVVHSENMGYGAFVRGNLKVVVDEVEPRPVQAFDLATDPGETRDVVTDPDYASRVQSLMEDAALPFLDPLPEWPGPTMIQLLRGISELTEAQVLADSQDGETT